MILTRWFPRPVTAQISALKTTPSTEKLPRFWIYVQANGGLC